MPTKILSNKPKLKGNIYCSVSCGGGCTKTEYDAAVKYAARLVSKIGEGWKPRVWENLGWHYSAVSECGRIKVHPSAFGNNSCYTVFVGDKDSPGGRYTATAKTLAKAFAEIKTMITQEQKSITEDLAAVNDNWRR